MQSIYLKKHNATIRLHNLFGKGIPILFVHGLGCASSSDYLAVVRDPSLRDQHVILVDLLGSGFSDKPTDFSYDISSHASVVIEIVQQLGLKKLHLFGHSMGGSIAITASTELQSQLVSLTLSEPNLDSGGGLFSRSITSTSEQDYCNGGHQQNIENARASKNDVWAGSLAVATAFSIHREATSLVQGTTPSWRETLLELKTPRTILLGQNSLPNEDFNTLPNLGIDVICIPQAGHSMAWENPSGLASAIAIATSCQESISK